MGEETRKKNREEGAESQAIRQEGKDREKATLISKQPVANGFQSTFQFRITNPGGLVQYTPHGFQQGGDGFAFVIQNFGIPVLGPSAGYLGYHGLPNSLAIEFDTWLNYEAGFFDPNGNHISVHSRSVLEALRKLYDAEALVRELTTGK